MSLSTLVPLRNLLLALAVVAVWGTNFVVIKVALADLPPLLFATLRFIFAVLPAIFFLPRPKVSWRNLAGYGLFIGVGQFGLLYLAMRGHISPGLASLVIQLQVFFTMGLALCKDGEALRPFQLAAAALALAGMGVIGAHVDGVTTPLGVALVVLAAFSWALGNMVGRAAGPGLNMLAYVVWSSLFAIAPLALLSLAVEGWPAMQAGLQRATWITWAAVLWQSLGNTLFGYGAWAWLLSRYAAGSITPMALLVPVFGMSASALLLREPLPAWKLIAAGLVLAGLSINVLWPRVRNRLAR